MLELKEKISFNRSDLDENGNVKASSIMYHFQEIASHHADSLGYGYDGLIRDDRIWDLSKLKFKIYDKLISEKEYILSTYPRPKKGLTFFRDYYLHDGEGILTAAGMSHWCIINFRTRKLEKTDINFDGEYIDHVPFEEGIEKIKAVDPVKAGSHVVTEADLDVNRHVNNCRYADIISGVLGKNNYGSFIMNFSKEAMLGDEILLYTEVQNKETIIVGKLKDGTVIFQAGVK